VSRKLTKLFNPRRHKWERHFRWDGPYLVGRTAIGRTMVVVLAMNHADVISSLPIADRRRSFPTWGMITRAEISPRMVDAENR
jgi:hypothetical protein